VGPGVGGPDGAEGGQVRVLVIGEDEGHVGLGEAVDEIGARQVPDDGIELLDPEVLDPFLVPVDDEDVRGLPEERLHHVVAGAPAPENQVFDLLFRPVHPSDGHMY
jgi:hypothetical protein